MMAALGHSTQQRLHSCLLSLTNEGCTAQEVGEACCPSRSLCIRNGGIKQKVLLRTQEVNTCSSFAQSRRPGSVGLVGPQMWVTRKLTKDGQTPHPLAEASGARTDLGLNPSSVTQWFCKPEPISLNLHLFISKMGITVPLREDHCEDEIM